MRWQRRGEEGKREKMEEGKRVANGKEENGGTKERGGGTRIFI